MQLCSNNLPSTNPWLSAPNCYNRAFVFNYTEPIPRAQFSDSFVNLCEAYLSLIVKTVRKRPRRPLRNRDPEADNTIPPDIAKLMAVLDDAPPPIRVSPAIKVQKSFKNAPRILDFFKSLRKTAEAERKFASRSSVKPERYHRYMLST